MDSHVVVWLAVVGGAVAFVTAVGCALAAAWLARAAHRTSHAPPAGMPVERLRLHSPAPLPVRPPVQVLIPPQTVLPAPQPPTIVVQLPPEQQYQPYPAPARHSSALPTEARVLPNHADALMLEGHYPRLASALGGWLQAEQDPVERTRIARDLGRLGSGDAARSLLDGVRTGVLSPTVAADQLLAGGFESGIAVAAALRDPDPRVRQLATSIVSRSNPVEAIYPAPVQHPLPDPPRGPTGGQG
ncbi:MAG: hypothetical protein KDC46_10030 [Thermoleophilia bacterium]|nr:hypothetical protein [Thermoleophilia bacterium]